MIKTLKGKISLVYLCLVIMIAVVGFVSVVNLYKLSGAIDGLMTANYKSINAVYNMLEAIERQDSAILIYINNDKQKGIDIFTDNNNVFVKWFDIERNNVTEVGEKELVSDIDSYYSGYMKSFLQLQEIRNSQGQEPAMDFYNSTLTTDFTGLKQAMKELAALNETSMFRGKARATEDSQSSMYVIITLTVLAISGGFFIARFSTNRFLKPIYSLTQTMKLVKAGDLNQQANLLSQDEIGELAREFNNMTKRLQQFEQSTLGKLMTEKNRFITIVKSISDPLIVMDASYKIALLNNASELFFGIREEKTVGRHFLEAVRNGELFDHISAAFESKEEHREKIILIPHDEEYYLNVVVTTLKDPEKNSTGIIVLFQNVTSLKQLEKLRTEFIATISHEFKTPLTSIMMGTDLLLNGGMGDLTEEQKSIASALKEDSEKLSTLVSDLLELSRIESGKTIYKFEPCSIAAIIEKSVKQFYQQAEHKNVALTFDAEEDLPKVLADYEKITWVLNNLISNALKYTNTGDEILVSASVKGDEMYVSVKDSGVGIPEEYQDRIFDKFVQVKGNDLEVRGTGLGLAVVKDIVAAHKGRIWCESKLDLGSCFTFTLKLS